MMLPAPPVWNHTARFDMIDKGSKQVPPWAAYQSFALNAARPRAQTSLLGVPTGNNCTANGGVIIQAIMALGRALGLTVLCEGVETEEQRILLRLAGCDEMQGFLFAKPAPRATIDRMLMGAPEREAARA